MFTYILKKEFLLISRDIHALLVLFIMPILFIVIMSLALKNTYSNTIDTKLKVAILSESNQQIELLNKEMNKDKLFHSFLVKEKDLKRLIYKKNFDIIVNIPNDYKQQITQNTKDFKIHLFTKPDLSYQNKEIFRNLLTKIISKDIMSGFFMKYKLDGRTLGLLDKKIFIEDIYKNEQFDITPTSVQHSVPSWLIFSMFFILIPISNTFINEKNFGTISRLKSIDISFISIIFGKIIPYYIINQIQVLLMIVVGIYLVPLLGGDSLQINGNYGLIFIISSFISFAAISFAMLIANISNTSEEATTIGGVSNIILAALGGIMVPKYVMPAFMQEITVYSPMNWGLESLLEVFIIGGGFNDIQNYLLYLIVFALSCLTLSYVILKKRENI